MLDVGLKALMWEVPELLVPFRGGPSNKDYNILGFILGVPCSGRLPCRA